MIPPLVYQRSEDRGSLKKAKSAFSQISVNAFFVNKRWDDPRYFKRHVLRKQAVR